MGCLKLSYYQTHKLKVISTKKILTFKKSIKKARRYNELKDHLANVKTVISDEKLITDAGTPNVIDNNDNFTPKVLNYNDYYPFGFGLPSRKYSSSGDYRFNFGGKELDPETDLEDFGMRGYKRQIGRFPSDDPRWKEFAGSSPYNYAANNPIRLTDDEGGGPGDPIFSFGFKSNFSLKATASTGVFASVTWKQQQVGFGAVSMEGGARGDLNFYAKKWGNGGLGVDGSAQAFFGVSVGADMNPVYRGFVNGGHQFSGSGVGSTSGSGTLGWNQTLQFGSKVNGENINQVIGGPYARVDWNTGSILASHLNDMWGDERDGYDGANGHITYSNFGHKTWQAGYAFQIVTPQPNVVNGKRVTEDGSYVTSNSKVNYFQESTLNFQTELGGGVLGGGITSRGKWTQQFWQNHVAHKDGNIAAGGFPTFKNTGTSGFKPGFKLTYSRDVFKK